MASILDGVGALECERIGYGGVHLCGDGSGAAHSDAGIGRGHLWDARSEAHSEGGAEGAGDGPLLRVGHGLSESNLDLQICSQI